MAKKLLSLIYMCLFLVSFAAAQTGTLTGTVTDQETGEPLPGVNIFLPGLERGAATNAQGEYTIEGIEFGTYELRASFIGYETYTTQVMIDQETVTHDIQLGGQLQQLEDVVVTALGIERQERSLGYSVEEVGGEDLNALQETNFVGTLTGKIAGANITNSNTIGGSSRIVLRGVSSLTGNNQPLFVVDGVPISNANFTTADQRRGAGGYDYGNAASVVNPNNVESVSVLKGASAAALYGARAANGVIQITTKSGEGVQGFGVNINSGVTFTEVYGLPDYQNLYGGGSNAPFRVNDEGQLVVDFATDESWGPRLDGRPVRQWYSYDNVNGLLGQTTPWVAHPGNVKDFFHNGVKFNNNISFAQGGEDYNFRLSLNNRQQSGIYPNSQFQRSQVSFNGSLQLTEKLNASLTTNYIYSDVLGRPGTGYGNQNVFMQFNHFGQRQIDLGEDSYMYNIFRPDSVLGYQRTWNWDNPVTGTIRFTDNPYWVRRMNYQDDDTQRIYGNVALSYDFMPSLTLTAEARTDFFTERRAERVAIGSQAIPGFEETVLEVQETNARVTLDYATDITDAFSFDAFVGGNARYEDLSQNIAETQGGLSAPEIYTIENSVSRPSITDFFQKEVVLSLFGATTFGYRDMLYLDLTLRNDWSSTLPSDNNSYLYPSASASFIFSELLGESDILSFGQLRLGWAKVGNDTDPYNIISTYPFDIPFGDLPQLSVQNVLSNPNLKPETTTSWEAGTSLEFFNSRLNLDVTYYNNETTDQIIRVEVSRGSGFSNILLNAGTVSNEGVELALNATPVQTNTGFRWSIGANWAKNVNTVEELLPGITNLTLGVAPFNVTVNARVGETYGAIVGPNFTYDENGNKVLSPSGTYIPTSDLQVLGSYVPDWTAGLSTTLYYKGFTLGAAINGQKGGDIYSISNAFGLYTGMFEETVENDVREVGMTPEGVLPNGEPYTGVVGPETFYRALFNVAAAHVYDASFIKLQQVSLSYTMPAQWFENTPIKGLQVSLLGRNLAILFKNSPNIDPTNVISSTNVQGIEAGQIPPQRSYGFNVQLNL